MPQSSFGNVTPDELVKIQRGTTFTNALGLDLAQWRQKKQHTTLYNTVKEWLRIELFYKREREHSLWRHYYSCYSNLSHCGT